MQKKKIVLNSDMIESITNICDGDEFVTQIIVNDGNSGRYLVLESVDTVLDMIER